MKGAFQSNLYTIPELDSAGNKEKPNQQSLSDIPSDVPSDIPTDIATNKHYKKSGGLSLVPVTDPNLKNAAKLIIEKHTIEKVTLENKLQREESDAMKKLFQKLEAKKKNAMERRKLELAKQLEEAEGDKEKEEVVESMVEKLEKEMKNIEEENEEFFQSKMQELIQERLRASEELKR